MAARSCISAAEERGSETICSGAAGASYAMHESLPRSPAVRIDHVRDVIDVIPREATSVAISNRTLPFWKIGKCFVGVACAATTVIIAAEIPS